MIDLTIEKNKQLSSQDLYDIMSFAMQSAEDGGFLNSFIFQRALYCFAAVVIFQERKDELAPMVAENVLTAWDALLEDGTLDELRANYQEEMDYLADNGRIWFEEFGAYAHSARGLLNTIQEFSGDILGEAANKLTATAKETGVQELLQVADEWGMNNHPISAEETVVEVDEESLF